MRSDITRYHFDELYLILSRTVERYQRGNQIQRTNTNLQSTSQKTKDRATRTSLRPGVNAGSPEGCAVPALLVAPVVLPRSFQIPYWRNDLL
jgi:hypothetical protein